MNYKIISDTSCEFPIEWSKDNRFERVGDKESFCPEEGEYLAAFETDADIIIVFTYSSKLSDSYINAMSARHTYIENCRKEGRVPKKIFVCDSKSSSSGEIKLTLKALEMIDKGLSFSDIQLSLMLLRNQIQTFFVKSTENSRTLMTSSDGEVIELEKSSKENQTFAKLVDFVSDSLKNKENKTIVISHCNSEKEASELKNMLVSKFSDAKVLILSALSSNSLYDSEGGVVIAV